jgi:hypothetical protein
MERPPLADIQAARVAADEDFGLIGWSAVTVGSSFFHLVRVSL